MSSVVYHIVNVIIYQTNDPSFLQVLGFGDYIEDVYAAYEQHKLETVVMIYLLLLILYTSKCYSFRPYYDFNLWGVV